MTSFTSDRILIRQNNGSLQHQREHIRTSAASSARFLPVATPTPSMAVPELHMTALTSAKSTLTSPGMVMMSEMPWTPCAQQEHP